MDERGYSQRKRRTRIVLFVCGLIFVALAVWLWPFLPKIPAILDLYVFKKKRVYAGATSAQNLAEISKALSLYIESEGAYPPKDEWMDKLLLFMRADDMAKEEQIKKLVAPGSAEGEFGYAFNGEIAGKWASEIEDPGKTPVIYDSSKLRRNAYDERPFESLPSPPRNGENMVLWADGRVSAAPR